MRLFTAIDIPDHVLVALSDLLRRLKPLAAFRWSSPENFHITTKFIGDWPANDLPKLTAVLAQTPKPGPIQITVAGLGWLPNPHHPRSLFAAIKAPPTLAEFAASTSAACESLGIPAEPRKYIPHLTLARINDDAGLADIRKAIASLPTLEFGSFVAHSHWLYESDFRRYTKLEEFPLQ